MSASLTTRPTVPIADLAGAFLPDPTATWSLGTFGALAEFARDADEAADVSLGHAPEGRAQVVTPRGALVLTADPAVRPVAFETAIGSGGSWNHAVALCLPRARAAMSQRTALTELGPDAEAPRAAARRDILFDLGLGAWQLDACVRVANPELLAVLRTAADRPLFTPGNPALSALLAAAPPRVFLCRFGRVEVHGPIPPAGGRSPDGPHTHILPRLLALGRTHAATSPIPDGWVPCAHLYPAHPARERQGRSRAPAPGDHARFQALLARFGDEEMLALKDRVAGMVRRGADPVSFPLPRTRALRAALKVTLRQLAVFEPRAAGLAAWRARFDPPARGR
jgi:hypothetical protein